VDVRLFSHHAMLPPAQHLSDAGSAARASHHGARLLGIPTLTLAALLVRLWGIDWENLWWDEALSVYRARAPWEELLSNTIRIQATETKDLHPPLYFVLLRLWMLGAGQSEYAVRAFSAFLGVLLVPLVAVLAARLAGRRAALPAAVLAALSPFAVWYGQEARMYTLVPLLSALSVYLLLRALEKGQAWLYVAYLAATTALLYTHYFGLFLLAVHAGCLLVAARQQTHTGLRRSLSVRRAPYRAVPLLVVLVGAPLTPYILWRLTTGHEWGRRLISLPQILWDTWRVHLAGLTSGWYAEALSAGVAAACAIVVLSVRRRQHSSATPGSLLDTSAGNGHPNGMSYRSAVAPRWTVPAMYLLVPAVAIFLFSLLKPLFGHVRYMSIVSPALYSVLGWAMGSSRRSAWLLSGLIALTLLYGNVTQCLDPTFRREDYAAAMRFIERYSRPGDAIIFYANGSEPAFLYHAGRGLPWYSLPRPEHDRTDPRLIGEELAPIAREHPRLWLVTLGPELADPRGLIAQWLEAHAVRSLSARFWGGGFGTALGVTRYETRPVYGSALSQLTGEVGGTPMDWPDTRRLRVAGLGINLGNTLRLHTAELTVNAAAGAATVTYYWEVLRSPIDELIISTRIVDPEGRIWAQRDSPPLNGQALASQWQAGMFVRDIHDVTLEDGMPPGRYQLVVEVYSLPARRGLEVINEHGIGSGTLVRIGEFSTLVPAPAALPLRLLPVHMGRVDLLEARLGTGSARPGESLRVQGLLRIPGRLAREAAGDGEDASLRLRARLVDNRGHPIRETIAPLLQTPLDLRKDIVVGWKLDLLLPAGVPSGRYRAQVALEPAGRGATSIRWEYLLRPSFWRPASSGTDGSVPAQAPLWPQPAARPADRGWVEVGEVYVQGRTPNMQVPRPQRVASYRVGDSVELIGYDVSTTSMQPGETLFVTLYWRCTAAMETSFTVFTHLLDPSGRLRGQHDDMPHRGALPTTSWVPGEYIVDRYEIQLAAEAPPGVYWLEVGMYDARTMVRLPVYAGSVRLADDRALLTSIMVQRAAPSQ